MSNGKPFTDILGEIENGQLLRDLTEAIYGVTAAVMETRKAGKIKFVMTISPTGKGTVNIDADFDAVEPEHSRPTTTFFVGKDLSLQRNDPAQPRLPLREVEAPANEPIRVTA